MLKCTRGMRKKCEVWGECSASYNNGEFPPCAVVAQNSTSDNKSMTKLLDNIERLINGVEPQYYIVPLKIMDVKREILDCISQLRHR